MTTKRNLDFNLTNHQLKSLQTLNVCIYDHVPLKFHAFLNWLVSSSVWVVWNELLWRFLRIHVLFYCHRLPKLNIIYLNLSIEKMSELSLNIVSIIAKCSTILCASKTESTKHQKLHLFKLLLLLSNWTWKLFHWFLWKKLLKTAYYCSKYH